MGFLSDMFGGDEFDRAREDIRSVPVPRQGDLTLNPQQYRLEGELDPAMIGTVNLGPSAYEMMETDPRLRGSQVDALAQYEAIAAAGGLDPIAKAALADALAEQQAASRGAQGAIAASARARGQGGSGFTYTQQMVADQAAATRGSRAALDTAAVGQQRRLDALGRGAALAGDVRNADFNEQSTLATARDKIKAYNAQNAQSVMEKNAQATNIARAGNLEARQGVSDRNVGLGNEAQQYNRRLPLELYEIQSGRARDIADTRAASAQAKGQAFGGALGAGASLAGAFALSDEREKEDVEPIDSREALRELSPAEWSYTDDPSGERHVGPMAQEFERTPEFSDMVAEDEQGTKFVNYGKAGLDGESGGKVFAVLADVSQRLEDIERFMQEMEGGSYA